jgi:addiction module HigA family antidote
MARLKPIHPGEILREEFMAPLHLNANKLALALHVPAPSIYDIVKEERGISLEMALRLTARPRLSVRSSRPHR